MTLYPSIPEIARAFENDPRTQLANRAIQIGTGVGPVAAGKYAWADGLARALQAGLGAYLQHKALKQYDAKQDDLMKLYADALGGTPQAMSDTPQVAGNTPDDMAANVLGIAATPSGGAGVRRRRNPLPNPPPRRWFHRPRQIALRASIRSRRYPIRPRLPKALPLPLRGFLRPR